MRLLATVMFLAMGIQVSAGAFDAAKLKSYEGQIATVMMSTAENTLTLISNEEKNKDKSSILSRVRLAILYHNASHFLFHKGVRGYAEKGVDVLEAVAKEKDMDEEWRPIVWSYLGSLKALVANESINPIAKIGGVNDGFKWMDQSVKEYGKVCYLPSFIRSNVASAVPDFFRKDKVAMDDLQFLDRSYSADPSFAPKDLMASVFLTLGNQYKKQKKIDIAVDYWKKSSALDPNGAGPGKAARDMLDVFADE